jgi:hypothetical protein
VDRASFRAASPCGVSVYRNTKLSSEDITKNSTKATAYIRVIRYVSANASESTNGRQGSHSHETPWSDNVHQNNSCAFGNGSASCRRVASGVQTTNSDNGVKGVIVDNGIQSDGSVKSAIGRQLALRLNSLAPKFWTCRSGANGTIGRSLATPIFC